MTTPVWRQPQPVYPSGYDNASTTNSAPSSASNKSFDSDPGLARQPQTVYPSDQVDSVSQERIDQLQQGLKQLGYGPLMEYSATEL